MEYRIQRLFLGLLLLSGFYFSSAHAQEDVRASDLDREIFELGIFTGFINIDDFGSEMLIGLSANFQASEDFFLQANYLQTDVDLSSFEQSQGSYFTGSDREFIHYDLLLGYNLFQGEMYPTEGSAYMSSFYLIGGVGDTRFGGEANFTITAGVGYQMAIRRKMILRVDYRTYLYETSLITSTEETAQSSQFTIGLNYLF